MRKEMGNLSASRFFLKMVIDAISQDDQREALLDNLSALIHKP